MRITDIVKHILILNGLFYVGSFILGEPSYGVPISEMTWGRLQLAMFYPGSDFFKPFQIITHMFMHADLMHLAFNMFGIFIFGPVLEKTLGPKKFLTFYFVAGFGALILHMIIKHFEMQYMDPNTAFQAVNTPMLGASGALFGLLAGYAMYYPDNVIQLIFPPIALKAKYFVLIYAAVELYLGFSGFQTGIAHFAHLGGALFGVLLILYWRNSR